MSASNVAKAKELVSGRGRLWPKSISVQNIILVLLKESYENNHSIKEVVEAESIYTLKYCGWTAIMENSIDIP